MFKLAALLSLTLVLAACQSSQKSSPRDPAQSSQGNGEVGSVVFSADDKYTRFCGKLTAIVGASTLSDGSDYLEISLERYDKKLSSTLQKNGFISHKNLSIFAVASVGKNVCATFWKENNENYISRLVVD